MKFSSSGTYICWPRNFNPKDHNRYHYHIQNKPFLGLIIHKTHFCFSVKCRHLISPAVIILTIFYESYKRKLKCLFEFFDRNLKYTRVTLRNTQSERRLQSYQQQKHQREFVERNLSRNLRYTFRNSG